MSSEGGIGCCKTKDGGHDTPEGSLDSIVSLITASFQQTWTTYILGPVDFHFQLIFLYLNYHFTINL